MVAIAFFVGVLELVEGSILLVEQLPVVVENVIVDHSGQGHGLLLPLLRWAKVTVPS